MLSWAATVQAAALEAGSAPALQELQRKFADQLAASPLKRPLVLKSAETDGGLRGDILVIVDHPLDELRRTLEQSSQWCDMLLLHLNNRRCSVSADTKGDMLTLSVVPRFDKPVDQAFQLAFSHRTVRSAQDYLLVNLSAAKGPMGTGNYRVMLEGVPLDGKRSLLHFAYAYDHNRAAKLATQAYLSTFGKDKVGFTQIGQTPAGEADYIRGLRGLVERNAMRYFLALDAYLQGNSAPAAERFERRLRTWFELTETYPRQLREPDLQSYLDAKREDRQRDAPTAPPSR